MRSVENFQRLVDLVPSPVNGIALCQGNFTLMTDDLPAVIRQYGRQEKIFFAHFRDVRGTAENFVETFHDEGKTDMLACLQAYKEVGYDGVLRPDHVPTMEGGLVLRTALVRAGWIHCDSLRIDFLQPESI
jgi:mannonate dehydratase